MWEFVRSLNCTFDMPKVLITCPVRISVRRSIYTARATDLGLTAYGSSEEVAVEKLGEVVAFWVESIDAIPDRLKSVMEKTGVEYKIPGSPIQEELSG